MEDPQQQIALLQRRLERERAARKEAEQLLEQKSLELYDLNQQLKAENLRIYKLVQAIPVAMMLYDHQQILSTNPVFHALFGEHPEGLSVDRYAEKLGLPLQDHPDDRIQYEIRGPEHSSTVLVQFVPLVDKHDPEMEHETLMVSIDISDRIKSDEAQQYAAFQSGIAEMSASILHNIGNIVTGMQGSLMQLGRVPERMERLEHGLINAVEHSKSVLNEGNESLLRGQIERDQQVAEAVTRILAELRGEEKMNQYLSKLELGVRHIGEIIQLQQKAARPETHVTRFNFSSMMEDTLSLIQDQTEKYGIEIVQDLSPDIHHVELPRNPMIQMVMNFIKNSMEAIGERIRTQQGHKGRIEIVVRPIDRGLFSMVIRDNGCGIEAERIEQIFGFGETNKEHGSGYGLHSAANFISSLKGSIDVESGGENRGAAMTIELPIRVGSP